MREIINKEQNIIQLNNKITRNKTTKWLVNKPMNKGFKMDYNKRVILKENNDIIDTLPYGF